MSQNPNQPAPGGLKPALKVAVPLVALVAVVFGVTYLGMYTPPTTTDDPNKTKEGAGSGGPPLVFFASGRRWDPPMLSAPGFRHFPLSAPSKLAPPEGEPAASYSLQDRVFQGFYEHGETTRRTPFWFENRHDKPVTMRLQRVSCTACSGARMAAIPPETTKELLQHAAISSLPMGPFNGFSIALARPAALLDKLEWTTAEFKTDPNATFHVPAATNADKWSPQWGILELTFKVQEHPSLPLQALFAAHVEGSSDWSEIPFRLMFEVANGFDLSKTVITVPDVTSQSTDSEYELIVYSSTRGPGSEFGDLEMPSCLVQTPPGVTEGAKFVEVKKIVRVPEDELVDVAEKLDKESKRLTNVRAAYRVTIALHPKVGEHRLDLGLLERHVFVSVPGVPGAAKQVTFRAQVRGTVWVEGNPTEIGLPSFRGADGLPGKDATINLVTAKPDMELTVVRSLCEFKDEKNPQGVLFELEKQPDRGGEGRYKLKLTIQPREVFGDFTGVIVLEVKSQTPGQPGQRIRIPFKGQSRL